MTDSEKEWQTAQQALVDAAVLVGATTFKMLVIDLLMKKQEYDLVTEIAKIPTPSTEEEATGMQNTVASAVEQRAAAVEASLSEPSPNE